MNNNMANAYQRNAIMTATPAELTLMLYEGAIKFCNIAIVAIKKKDFEMEKLYKFVSENFDETEGYACDKVIDNILLK